MAGIKIKLAKCHQSLGQLSCLILSTCPLLSTTSGTPATLPCMLRDTKQNQNMPKLLQQKNQSLNWSHQKSSFSKFLSAGVVIHPLVGAPLTDLFCSQSLGKRPALFQSGCYVCECIYICKNTNSYEKIIKNQICTFHSRSGATESVND